MTPARESVLVWKYGALGDLLMCTPMLRQLRRALPDAHIRCLVGRASAAAIAGHPSPDACEVFDERAFTSAGAWRLAGLLPRLAGHDRVFVLDKHRIFTTLARLAGGHQRVGFDRDGEGRGHHVRVPYGAVRHEIHYGLDLLEAAGLPVDRDDVMLDAPVVPGGVAPPLPADYLVLVNAGGLNPREDSAVRRLPAPLFDALLARCRSLGPVVFLGSAAERGAYPEDSPGLVNLAGRTSLAQAAVVMRGARAVITTDCGLMHLAGSVRVPTVALFGPTHPQRKCPPGAVAVWCDADRYDPAYETYGRRPAGRWFERMTPEQVMAALPPR
ncbi:glycosyltransferase family 9 protein [Rubrivivax gelatinosus]|uniref:glycosyltransferase family 9 protein n=1 Tax=Rubrivivax gelatinosus TaxID=28068 RepID=UPI0002F3AF80|nr:glycosyltransferase family 9 protein [Rubrivivax gelatinosus]MBG6079905.1 ADP-heptose:LPS heptosyltransferase [Rubrivivax gelatinosus]